MHLLELSPTLLVGLALCGFVVSQTAWGVIGGWRKKRKCNRDRVTRKLAFLEQVAALARAARAAETRFAAWKGTRPLRLAAVVDEADNVRSFYLTPDDDYSLAPFEPGQYLTLHLSIADFDRPLVRCYSLSDRPREDYYRLTIKRSLPPREHPDVPCGRASNYLHDHVRVGDLLQVAAPRGNFFLRPERKTPIVLIAGGIGITPLLSMINDLTHRGLTEEVYVFVGVRNGRQHPFKEHLEQLASEHPKLRLLVSYSAPRNHDEPYRDFQHVGRVTIDHLREVLPSNRFDFYLCGPGSMLEDLVEGLDAWGVPEERIHLEAFGPSTVRRTKKAESTGSIGSFVRFDRSDRVSEWKADCASLLDLGEAAGVPLVSGCRVGNCGACLVPLDGKVQTLCEPGFPVPTGHCLTCISVPAGDVVLEA